MKTFRINELYKGLVWNQAALADALNLFLLQHFSSIKKAMKSGSLYSRTNNNINKT